MTRRGTIHRASERFLPTLREDPAEAEAASHRLLLRAGCVRQVGAGLYAFMPLGWRVYRKVEQIIREEMDAIGCQEMLMPLMAPADLWQRTGRYDIQELFHVTDRADRPFVLSMTHEETITYLAREISSYRQLPQLWYHFGLKERDEPRPRAGLLRTREFIMKDSYSFDRDEAGLDVSYEKHAGAYRRTFERLGLRFYEVESDTGMMGGSGAHEYMAPCDAGENDVVLCGACDYAANVEVATSRPTAPSFPDGLDVPQEVETPDVHTIEALAGFLGIDPRATAKAMPVVGPDDELVLGLIRGDHRLHELKMRKALGGDFRPAHPEEIREAFGADGGSLGPVGVSLTIVADESLREGQFVVGANRNGWHLRGVEAGRDFVPTRWLDLREAQAGDGCPRCGSAIVVEPAIEVGNIFKLGTRYSEALGAAFLDEAGVERPIVMGSYGIGPARTLAAVVEQQHDEKGITWPAQLAPYDVHVVAIAGQSGEASTLAEQVASDLEASGFTVLLDDRDQRPGEKFADADLIGCPLRVTVGKKTLEDGSVDLRHRSTGEESRVPLANVAGRVLGAA